MFFFLSKSGYLLHELWSSKFRHGKRNQAVVWDQPDAPVLTLIIVSIDAKYLLHQSRHSRSISSSSSAWAFFFFLFFPTISSPSSEPFESSFCNHTKTALWICLTSKTLSSSFRSQTSAPILKYLPQIWILFFSSWVDSVRSSEGSESNDSLTQNHWEIFLLSKTSTWNQGTNHVYCYGVSFLRYERFLFIHSDGHVLRLEGDGLHGAGGGSLRGGGQCEPWTCRQSQLLRMVPHTRPG